MLSFENLKILQSIPTPFYYYDMDLLNQNADQLQQLAGNNGIKVYYAVKANNNIPIMELLSARRFGADCVSASEINRAIEAGFSPSDIVYAGVGKTDDEIVFALKNNIARFNCESIHELQVLDEIAGQMGKTATIALRINPDHDAQTHEKITTGTRFNKFGIPMNEINLAIEKLKDLKKIGFDGLHFHIGSQITNMQIFTGLTEKVNSIQKIFIDAGLHPLSINLGGGLGVDYEHPDANQIPDYNTYFDSITKKLEIRYDQELSIEPGRSVVAGCGSLISKVLYLKNSEDADFAIVDAGMNDLMRPALYGARHAIQKLSGIGKKKNYHVVGPICESSDIFSKNIQLPELERGDYLAIRTAGAYGEVMASGYNLRQLPKAVYSTDFKISEFDKKHFSISI